MQCPRCNVTFFVSPPKEMESISFFSFSSSVLIYWQVVVLESTCPECMVCSTIQSIKKVGAAKACNCIFACHNHQSWLEKKFSRAILHSMQVLVTVMTLPFRPVSTSDILTFDHSGSRFWPCCVRDSQREFQNEWPTLISWQRPKKAKFSIWVPKLTLALCWKRILPRRSTRQKIIHQVVNKRMQDFTICIKM